MPKTKITRCEGLQAAKFIAEQLEDSKRYDLLSTDQNSIKVMDKSSLVEDPKTIEVIISNSFPNASNLYQRYRANARSHHYTVPVFYKDRNTAFVRLYDISPDWMHNQTLKKYPPCERNKIIKLRKKEELVMQYFGLRVLYYQPETTDLPESIVDFRMMPVTGDFTHLDPESDAARHVVNDCVYKTFKLPEEVDRITVPAGIIVIVNGVDHLWRGRLEKTASKYKEDANRQLLLF